MTVNKMGIENCLDRGRIRKLLAIGLFASVLTGIGDFLLGYGEETAAEGFAASVLANAVNLSDAQLVWGSLLGAFGLLLEGLSFFGIWRLMADAAPRYAHIYRSGIFLYIWAAPIGCHMNVGLMNLAYKYLMPLDPALAGRLADLMIFAFCLPVWVCLIAGWVPMLIVQFRAFSEGLTPYPRSARWFSLVPGCLPALLLSAILGPGTALGSAVGTTFLSVGNAFTFGGLLASLPDEAAFASFRKKLAAGKEGE